MISISCENVSLSYGTDVILDKISFGLNEGDKLGIVGVNGAGKSTLFKIITGEYEQDSGSVYLAKSKSVGFLNQNLDFDYDGTVREAALSGFGDLLSAEKKLEDVKNRLEAGDVSLADEFTRLHDEFTQNGGYEFRGRVRGMLRSLGLKDEVWEMKVADLSGGQKTRLEISCLLLREPDILMLDEPTNHLDIGALEWLEDFIKQYKKTVVLISHDRYFLDRTVNRILEIENTHGTLYKGNYSSYVKQKEENREIRERHYQNQQKEISRIEAYIEQQRRWNRERNIIAAESREKQLAKMERCERPENLPDKISLKFEKAEESGNDVLEVKGISAAYGENRLFDNLSFEVKKNDRLFIVGENGCGKSTLIKMLMQKIPLQSGCLQYGYNVRTGYYDQENQQLSDDNTVMDELWNSFEKMTQTEIRKALALFLFKGEDVLKKVEVLSGGERARLTLSKLVLSKNNLLILDEPTNHLDVNSREALEKALEAFNGTIIAVSHDRYFINKLSTRILGFNKTQKTVMDFYGNYEEYRSYIAGNENRSETEISDKKENNSKEQYLKNKKETAEKRKAEARIRKAQEEARLTEEAIERIDKEMQGDAAFDHIRYTELYNEKEKLEERLLELYEILT